MFQTPEDIVATSQEFSGSSCRLLDLFSIVCWTLSPPPSFCFDLRNSEISAGNGSDLTKIHKHKQKSVRALNYHLVRRLRFLTDKIFVKLNLYFRRYSVFGCKGSKGILFCIEYSLVESRIFIGSCLNKNQIFVCAVCISSFIKSFKRHATDSVS